MKKETRRLQEEAELNFKLYSSCNRVLEAITIPELDEEWIKVFRQKAFNRYLALKNLYLAQVDCTERKGNFKPRTLKQRQWTVRSWTMFFVCASAISKLQIIHKNFPSLQKEFSTAICALGRLQEAVRGTAEVIPINY